MIRTEVDTELISAIDIAKKEAESIIVARYERPTNLYYVLQYHSLRHSREVAERISSTFRLLSPIAGLIDPRDRLLYPSLGLNHDRVNDFDVKVFDLNGSPAVKMQRYTGQNEKDSANETKEVLSGINTTLGKTIFTCEDKVKTDEAFDVTIPSFDTTLVTVFQPSLNRETSVGARILALSDLNTALLDPQRFLENGNELFREENFDVLEVLLHKDPISKLQERFIKERMIGWSKMQIPFALGRQKRLPLELEGLPEEAVDILKRLYSMGLESAEAASQTAKERENMTLPELFRSFGYDVDTRVRYFHPRHFASAA